MGGPKHFEVSSTWGIPSPSYIKSSRLHTTTVQMLLMEGQSLHLMLTTRRQNGSSTTWTVWSYSKGTLGAWTLWNYPTYSLLWRALKFLIRPRKGPTMLKSVSSWNLVLFPTSSTKGGERGVLKAPGLDKRDNLFSYLILHQQPSKQLLVLG